MYVLIMSWHPVLRALFYMIYNILSLIEIQKRQVRLTCLLWKSLIDFYIKNKEEKPGRGGRVAAGLIL